MLSTIKITPIDGSSDYHVEMIDACRPSNVARQFLRGEGVRV